MRVQCHSRKEITVLIVALIGTGCITYAICASKLPVEPAIITLLAFLTAALLGIAKTTTV